MKKDYSSFLFVADDGNIWWRLSDALKLGAGYIPSYDEKQDLVTTLKAPNNQVRANERALVGAFSDDRLQMWRPGTIDRDGVHFVDASMFLDWLAQYLTQTQSETHFPNELFHYVRAALDKASARLEASDKKFESLTLALEDWFDTPLRDLPELLRRRVETEFFPMPWEGVTPDQRRSVALQNDYRNDPATESDRQYWWDFYIRGEELKAQLVKWEAAATPTAGDLALKESRLKELRQELARMEHQQRQARGDYFPQNGIAPETTLKLPTQYIAYPKAMKLLAKRFDAMPEELAAWVFAGGSDGGLGAFLNANELNPPPKFFYSQCIGNQDEFDYLSPLMACWFRETDIIQFEPANRYITGKALIERWRQYPEIQPYAFICAKIRESRLQDMHPIQGLSQGTNPNDSSSPSLEIALFKISDVEDVEAEDFGVVKSSDSGRKTPKPREHLNHDPEMQKRANEIAAEKKKETKWAVTRDKVGKLLAKELNMDEETVIRRIRKEW